MDIPDLERQGSSDSYHSSFSYDEDAEYDDYCDEYDAEGGGDSLDKERQSDSRQPHSPSSSSTPSDNLEQAPNDFRLLKEDVKEINEHIDGVEVGLWETNMSAGVWLSLDVASRLLLDQERSMAWGLSMYIIFVCLFL